MAPVAVSLDQPAAIVAAAGWVQQVLLGTLGTVVAVIAVAAMGFSMLYGLVSVRRGMMVVLGCFILFAAPTIAAGLRKLGYAGEASAQDLPISSETPPQPEPSAADTYDPYAGPGVPNR